MSEIKRLFSIKTDPYLLDHQIDGIPFVPFVVLVEEIMANTKFETNTSVVKSFTDISIHTPLMLRKNREQTTMIMQTFDTFEIRLNNGSIVMTAKMPQSFNYSPSRLPINKPSSLIHLAKSEIYSKVFFHGKTFQADFSIGRISAREAYFEIYNVKLNPISLSHFDNNHAAAIVLGDLAIQCAGLFYINQKQRYGIPWGAQQYTRVSNFPLDISNFCCYLQQQSDKYSIDVFTANGEFILSWQHLDLREMTILPSTEVLNTLNII